MSKDLDALKRENLAKLASHPDYHPTLRDASALPMVRCPVTGSAARGQSWMSLTEPGRTVCAQCASEAEWSAMGEAREAWLGKGTDR